MRAAFLFLSLSSLSQCSYLSPFIKKIPACIGGARGRNDIWDLLEVLAFAPLVWFATICVANAFDIGLSVWVALFYPIDGFALCWGDSARPV